MILIFLAIGSTHVVTPRGFVDDLKVLDLGGAGSKAIPNGLIDRRDGQRPWQVIYDEKYYTQDALPPPRQQAPQPTASRLQQTFSHGSHSSSSHSQSVLHKPIQPSPTPSYSSYSGQPIVEEKKKKKRGLFGF
jgi:syntaxin-binding protein 1